MEITLNGQAREVADEQTLLDLLEAAGYRGKRVAVEINRRIVPRSTHSNCRINSGDRIEIVHAIGGG